METEAREEKKTFTLYRIMLCGMTAEILAILLKVANVINIGWIATLFIPLTLMYLAIFLAILIMIVKDKYKNSTKRRLIK